MTTPADLGLTNRGLRVARVEGATLPPGGVATLADLTGAGTVVEVFVAVGDTAGVLPYDAVVEVYADGATLPDLAVDLGTLFVTHLGQTTGPQFSCDRAHVEISADGKAAGYTLRLPIPYRAGLRILLRNPTAAGGTLWAQVFYTPGPGAPLRLRGSARTWPNRLSLSAADTPTLLDVPGPGWLAWLSLCGLGGAGMGWLERDVEVTVDGVLVNSTGLEDWFGGAFYWMGRRNFGTPWALIGYVDPGRWAACAALDLIKLYGGIRYDTSARVVLGTEQGLNTGHQQSHLIVYYEELTP